MRKMYVRLWLERSLFAVDFSLAVVILIAHLNSETSLLGSKIYSGDLDLFQSSLESLTTAKDID